tara:strand:- start:335 stop:538 length:204 start_codon:yes stop_codon:yes gene_type:complete
MKKLATGLALLGAVLLAAQTGLTLIAYCVMMASSVIFIAKLWKSEREVVALNMGFCAINLFGVFQAM